LVINKTNTSRMVLFGINPRFAVGNGTQWILNSMEWTAPNTTDSTSPVIHYSSFTGQNFSATDKISFTANVSDDVAIYDVIVNYSFNPPAWHTLELTRGLDGIWSATIGPVETLAAYEINQSMKFEIIAQDTWSNPDRTSFEVIHNKHDDPPELTANPPSTANLNETKTITIDTDEDARCRWSHNNDDYAEMEDDSEHQLTGSWTTEHEFDYTFEDDDTKYDFYIRCLDEFGHESESLRIDITVGDPYQPVEEEEDSPSSPGGPPPPTEDNPFEFTIAEITTDSSFTKEFDGDVPITKLTIAVSENSSDISFGITKEESLPVSIPAEPVIQYLNMDHENLGPIQEAFIEFRVNQSLVTEDMDVFLLRYDGAWQRLDTVYLKQVGDYLYYQASTPGFSYFAIAYTILNATQPNGSDGGNGADGTDNENGTVSTDETTPGDNASINSTSGNLTSGGAGPTGNGGGFNWANLIYFLISLLVLVGGGVAAFIIYQKRKNPF
ncbi:MAG: PGF-pre-PGF domain-containing protein, partial [Nanobdellota archaeon]